MPTPRVRLGDLLVEAQIVTPEQLEEVLALQRTDGRRLGTLLVECGLVTETQVTQILSQQLSVPWVSLYHIDFSRQLLNLVPRDVAERFCLVPIFVRRVRGLGEALYVAMDDPSDDRAQAEVAQYSGLHVRAMIAPPTDIRSAIRVYYGGKDRSSSLSEAVAELQADEVHAKKAPSAPPTLAVGPARTGATQPAPAPDLAPAATTPAATTPAEPVQSSESQGTTSAAEADVREMRGEQPSIEVEFTTDVDEPEEAEAPAPAPTVEPTPAPVLDLAPAPAAAPASQPPSQHDEVAASPPPAAPASAPPSKDDEVAALPPPVAPVAAPPWRPPSPVVEPASSVAAPDTSPTPTPSSVFAAAAAARRARPSDPARRAQHEELSAAFTPAPDSTRIAPRQSDMPRPARGPAQRILTLTLLDGTTVNLPARSKSEVPAADAPGGEGGDSDQLTARDLVAALRAVSHGADASEILGENVRWEALFSTLLSLLLKKHLIADWEFVEEYKKI